MKIGILCSSKLSLPAVHSLINLGHQVFMATPEELGPDKYELEGFANQFGIQISKFSKETLTESVLFWKANFNLEHIFVITFPYILKPKLIDSVGLKIINFHFAPLPEYKGAQPAFWMIKNGERKGGITAHVIDQSVDGGAILHFEPFQLSETETFGSYFTKMAHLNSVVIQKVLGKIAGNGWARSLVKQTTVDAKNYPKPQLQDIRIDWQKMTAEEIERLCRACNPWNKGAITTLNNAPIKLIEVQISNSTVNELAPGEVVQKTATDSFLVSTSDHKFLNIIIAFSEELGYLSNYRLNDLGFRNGVRLI